MADPPAAPPAPERINLIMAGGGVRFPAYVGALAAFGELGVEIVNVAGASAAFSPRAGR